MKLKKTNGAQMKIIAIIPARYDSTRFPGKPLVKLGQKPIIQHVYERAKNSGLFDEVIVATDDQRIFEAVHDINGKVILTSKKHHSGTDRIAEVCSKIECDLVVNIQGDEPFISKEPLQKLISAFKDKEVEVATLMHKIKIDIENPNNVKVVCDKENFALYFSRSKIPFYRNSQSQFPKPDYYKHIGVYAFRKESLMEFINLPAGKLEQNEKLEQLRLLENGMKIKMVETEYEGIGIDTKKDLERAERIRNSLKNKVR